MIRALIIEDEAHGLTNLLNALAKHCPDVEVKATGGTNADLIKLCNDERQGPFDVAFLDINLSDGNVFKGLKELEEIPFEAGTHERKAPLRPSDRPSRPA